jgi:uncharacterized membrane protein
MTELLIASLAFSLTHLGISSTPARQWLISLMGKNGYLIAYSLIAFGTLGAMIYAYSDVSHTDFVWLPSVLGYKCAKAIMFFAIVLLVLGTMIRNPTSMVWPDAINDEYRGVIKITHHPIQWSIMLYAIAHLIANGDKASIVLFGTLGLVALLGPFAMDAKKRALNDPKWQSFLDSTSNVPFAALISGRTRLASHDINYLAIVIGIALYTAICWLHSMVSGGLGLY